MSDFRDSIVLISSSDPNIRHFGTGFLIKRDENTGYVLTCAHMIDDVGGPDAVKAGGHKADVVAIGASDGIDLAVLSVEGLINHPPLNLNASGRESASCYAIGFRKYAKHFLLRRLESQLGEQIGLVALNQPGYMQAWDLIIKDDHPLEPGSSGSPVIDKANNYVIGIVTHRQGEGRTGLVIAIENLAEIWWGISFNLTDLRNRKRRIDTELFEASTHLYYEVEMLVGCKYYIEKRNQLDIIKNALLEAFAIHSRSILNFLYAPPGTGPDKIIAEDFLDKPERWQEFRLAKTELLKLIHWRVEKEMTHLTYTRLQLMPNERGWPVAKIYADILAVLRRFLLEVDSGKLDPRLYELINIRD